jgi:tRNA(Ile)-lysidine synthetase-like protein
MSVKSDKKKIGLAVSGGIDSCYLMHKYAPFSDNIDYVVLSVNHGLRPEAESEILWVKKTAENLGLQFCDLKITTAKPTSGIQEFARNARYRLLADYAKQHSLDAIFLGHHSDDQAETILSRLNHKSGYMGLCGMADVFYYDDVCFKRPLLNLSRFEITQSMTGKDYIHDPSNDNTHYERVRNRQFLNQNPQIKQALLTLSMNARRLCYPVFIQRNIFLKSYSMFSPYGYVYVNHTMFKQQDPLLQQEILKYAIKYATGNFYINTIPALIGKNFTVSNAEMCFTKEYIKIFAENRNVVDYNPKRFVKTDMGLNKNDDDIPHKAKQTLPSGYFAYKPQSLHYYVLGFDIFLA